MSSSGLCVSCKKPLTPPDANFCAKCGSPQSRPQQDRLCVLCKSQLPSNAMFCVKCGTLQPHSQQQGIQKSTTPQKPKEEIDNDKKKPSHLTPNLPKQLLPVLHVPREEAVKIQFNAVIHLKIWKWEKGKSSIFMRFGHKELGGWKRDIGPCIFHKDAGNGFYIVRHELYVGYEFLKANWNNQSYKYVVYSPRSNDIGHQYEFLHAGTPTFDYNRLLRVPQYQLKPGGCYQQFDTMILPQLKTTTTKSTVGKWWDSADASKSPTITLPSPDIICSQCMELYLQTTRDLLINGTFSANLSIQEIVEECVRFFECFCVQWLEHKGKEEKWIVALDPSIKKWFESVLDVLLTSELESHLCVISGVLIAWCLKNLMKSRNIDIKDDMKTGLLQVMSLTVANGEKELEFLQSMLRSLEEKKNVLDVLLYYWRAVIDLGKDMHILTVIKALPLYHFLSGMSLPNQPLHIALKEAHWKDSALNFTQLKELMENNSNFVEMYHDTIMQLFQFDLQFLALIPYFYPQNDTSVVCGILPVELAIVWLIARLQLSNCSLSLSSISVNKMEQDLMNPMTCILQRLFSIEINKFTFLSRCLEAAIYFMESFKESLNNSRNTEIFVTSMVSLFLHILHRAKSFNDKTNDQESYCQILKDKTRKLLKNWVICANVVDRKVEPLEAKLEKLEQELKFWKTILSIPLPADEMKNELEAIVLDLVNARVSEIPTAQLKIDAFVSVKTWKGIPDSLRNVFLTKAMEALGTILSQEATESCSDYVMKFISKIIEERAPSHASSSNTSHARSSPESGHSLTPSIKERGTSPTPFSAISASLAMLSPHSPDQTEYFIVADDSTSSLQKDNKTSDINPLQGLATVHSQGIDGNVSLPKEGGRKNKEGNKESKRRGENEDSGKWESGSGRSEEGIKTSGIGEYGKDETGERNNVKSQVKPHNPQTDHRNTHSSLLFPNLPPTPFDVLNPSKDKTMKIQFNAVIQISIWEWEEGRSTVYMRFGNKELGNWKYDIGPCVLQRDAGHGFYAVKYDMTVNSEFMVSLKIGLPYKYVVYSSKTNQIGHQYEYLHGAPPYDNPNNNRLLRVPMEKLGPGAYYRQFDTMILPDVKVKAPKGRLKKAWDFFSGAEPDDSDAITVPTPTLMRSQCMEIHLQPTRNILLSGNLKINLEGTINGLVSLIRCAFLQWVEHRGAQYSWEVTDISPFLIEWVQSVLVDINKCRDTVPHAVTSSALLACCLHKLRKIYNIPISDELIISLLQAISLSVTNGEKELNFLKSMMQRNYQASLNSVVTALVYYLRSVIELENSDNAIIVVKTLPLYHFLCDLSVPYQQSHVPLNKIAWGDDSLLMPNLQMTLRNKKGFVQKYEKDIQQLLQFDSQLLYIIPYICPQEDTSALCNILPLQLATVWLIERLNLHGRYSLRLSAISKDKMENCFKIPLAGIMQRLNERGVANFDVLLQCSDAAFCLLASFKEKLDNSNNAKIIVKSMISLFLHILHKANIFDGKTNDQESLCQMLRVNVQDLLKDWVIRDDIVGGSFFGAAVKFAGTAYQELKKEDEELEFWETVLAIKLPADDMENELEAIVLDLVGDRVSKIPAHQLKIDLFINVAKKKGTSDSFRNIFLMKAIEALDNMFSKRATQSIQRWDTLLDLQSDRVVKLISKIIEKRYPHFRTTQEVPFDDLLEWEMWPGVLKIYYAEVGKESRESNDWKLIVICAVSKLEEVCTNIHSGNITITELRSIIAKQTQMNKLCEVTIKSQLAESMEKRLKEFKHFEAYKMKLEHLLSHIGKVLIDQPDLMKELQRNFEEQKINKLCVTSSSDGSCSVVCFPDARPLDPCLDNFYIISSHYSSDIFNRIWQETLKAIGQLLFTDVDESLWRPALQSCISLLAKLKAGDMTLLDIDQQFKRIYFKRLSQLEHDLINLQHGVNVIKRASASDSNWIKKVVVNIGQYWDLCEYREAAEAFLKIRDTLKLTGDFAIVERVASKVSSGAATLSTIDHSVVEAARFLQEYAADPTKRECLEAFAECQKIVKWIRKETQDVTNLVNFVTVALATAAGGEGDMTTDKLSFLRTVGSGFGPLIYRLPKDASYQTLQEWCKTLWATLETTPNLPGMMRTCEREIDWYKSFKKKYDLRFK